jgi:hypothetical protein
MYSVDIDLYSLFVCSLFNDAFSVFQIIERRIYIVYKTGSTWGLFKICILLSVSYQ